MTSEKFDKYSTNLKRILESFGDLPAKSWEQFISNFKIVEYKKGEYLLSPDERADISFFIGKGLVKRFFISEDGREYITDFDKENRMVSDYVSFLSGAKSRIYIQALEDCDVLVSNYGYKERIQVDSLVWTRNSRIIAERRYIEKANREYNLLHYKAQERLEIFREEDPDLFNRISQKDLSSYLGVTPQSLSRLLK